MAIEDLGIELENGERKVRATNGIAVNFETFQEIENGLTSLLADSASDLLNAARRIGGEGIRASAAVTCDTVRAAEEVGSAMTSGARGFAKGVVGGIGEVLREGITVTSRVIQTAGEEALGIGSVFARVVKDLLLGLVDGASEVAAAVLPKPRTAT